MNAKTLPFRPAALLLPWLRRAVPHEPQKALKRLLVRLAIPVFAFALFLALWTAASHRIVDEGLLLADRIVPLTPGPDATLGPAFDVKLPRPRDRKAINHDAAFKRLRNDVIRYLGGLRRAPSEPRPVDDGDPDLGLPTGLAPLEQSL